MNILNKIRKEIEFNKLTKQYEQYLRKIKNMNNYMQRLRMGENCGPLDPEILYPEAEAHLTELNELLSKTKYQMELFA